jgi:hypothetical protein
MLVDQGLERVSKHESWQNASRGLFLSLVVIQVMQFQGKVSEIKRDAKKRFYMDHYTAEVRDSNWNINHRVVMCVNMDEGKETKQHRN